VVGNHAIRMLATLLYPLRGVSVIVRGEAGSAKSTLIRGALALAFGPEALDDQKRELLLWGGSSDKALLTEDNVDRIETTATHCAIPELEFVLTTDRGFDIVKMWTEGEPYPYERATEFGRRSTKLVLRPLPILTSVANESPRLKDLAEEMERRFLPLFTESSREMNERIHRRKAEIEAYPDARLFLDGVQRYDTLHHHIEDVMEKDFGGLRASSHPMELVEDRPLIGVKNPCAPYMVGIVPKRFTISNTYIDYWHEMVKAITAFYYPQRPIYDVGTEKYLMATPTDNYLAWLVGGQVIVDASLRLRDLGHVLMGIVPTLDYKYGGDMLDEGAKSLDRIVDEISAKGYERSRSQIKELLLRLVMANYVKMDDKDRYWKTHEYGDEFVANFNWQDCLDETKKLMRETYPAVASDYISMYCEDPVCVHPFTGEKIRILDTTGVCRTQEPIKTKKRVSIDQLEGFI